MKVIHHHNVGATLTACDKTITPYIDTSSKWESVTCKTCIKDKKRSELMKDFMKVRT